MKDTMNYKTYTGRIEYDNEARIFHGQVLGLTDIITFQGRSIDELETALKDSVEDYLDMCKEMDKKIESGEDLGDYLIKESASKNVLVSFPLEMLKAIDFEATALGVPRTALIKMWLGDRLKTEKEYRKNNNS